MSYETGSSTANKILLAAFHQYSSEDCDTSYCFLDGWCIYFDVPH